MTSWKTQAPSIIIIRTQCIQPSQNHHLVWSRSQVKESVTPWKINKSHDKELWNSGKSGGEMDAFIQSRFYFASAKFRGPRNESTGPKEPWIISKTKMQLRSERDRPNQIGRAVFFSFLLNWIEFQAFPPNRICVCSILPKWLCQSQCGAFCAWPEI